MRVTGMRGSGLIQLAVVVSLFWATCTVGGAAEAPKPLPAWRETVRAFAAEHFKNPAWGYSHSVRDYALARNLAAADHVVLDDDVLYAAAYLHDMAAFPPWAKPDVDHADAAAAVVDTVLKGTGFPMGKIDAVRGAIRTHMYQRDPWVPKHCTCMTLTPLTGLGRLVWLGFIALVDPNGGKPTGPEIIPMLEENLSEVPSRVLSPAGKAQVASRTGELSKFLSDLRRESDDLHAL